MYKSIIGIVALVFSLVGSQAVLANEWGCGEGLKSMLQSLKLQDTQKEKIKPILDNLREGMVTKGKAIGDLDTQIEQQCMSATMDQSTVDGLVDKKSALIGDMMKAKVTAKNQIFNILDDKQRASLQDMMKKLEAKLEAKYKSCHKDD